jgi:uncharacterized protein YukE
MVRRSDFSRYFPAQAILSGMILCFGAPAHLSAQGAASPPPISPTTQSGSAAPQTTTPAATSQAKHVWTNDDVTQLQGQSNISTVGSKAKATKPTATTAKPRPKTAAYYNDQITRLQAQLPAIDGQIATLQDALSGKTVDETRKYAGVKLDDWHAELTALQAKRASILEQIASLQDQARHDGVPTNSLP